MSTMLYLCSIISCNITVPYAWVSLQHVVYIKCFTFIAHDRFFFMVISVCFFNTCLRVLIKVVDHTTIVCGVIHIYCINVTLTIRLPFNLNPELGIQLTGET